MLDRGPLLARETEPGKQHIFVRGVAHIGEEFIRTNAHDRWLAMSLAGDNDERFLRDLTIGHPYRASVAVLPSDGVIERKREFVAAKPNRFVPRQIRPGMDECFRPRPGEAIVTRDLVIGSRAV